MSNTYLVQYGRSAFVGRFVADATFTAERGESVVVRTPRGDEIGTVLCSADDRFPGSFDADPNARVLRRLRESEADEANAVALAVLSDAGQRTSELDLPITLIDAETMLDGGPVILHALPWGNADLDPLLAALSARHGRPIHLFDVTRIPTIADPPDPSAGCGKPECGTGGCSTSGNGGCSTGGCSRSKVKSAEELTGYFVSLREKMEAAGVGRTPLN